MSLSSPIYDSIMNELQQESDNTTNSLKMAHSYIERSRLATSNQPPPETSNDRLTSSIDSAMATGIPSASTTNNSDKLDRTINRWESEGKVYNQKRGVGQSDCSKSASCIVKGAYGKNIPNTTKGQRDTLPWSKKGTRGNLVQFKTGKDSYHVGIMLDNDKFWNFGRSGSKTSSVKEYSKKHKFLGYQTY